MLNAYLRLGSVTTFLINPLLYNRYGIVTTLWVAAAVAILGVFAATGTLLASKSYSRLYGDNGSGEYETQLTKNKDSIYSLGEEDEWSNSSSSSSKYRTSDNASDNIIDSNNNGSINNDSASNGDMNSIHSASDSNRIRSVDTNNERKSSILGSSAWCNLLLRYMPVHEFGAQYFVFILSGAFLYGAMVGHYIPRLNNTMSAMNPFETISFHY
jgi:hypothetical protein